MVDITNLRSITDATFQTNPDYDLVSYGKLPPDYQEMARNLLGDADFYGLLIPKQQSGLTIKSVDKDTALLLFTLKEAGQLPSYLTAAANGTLNQEVAQLVSDGILQMESNGQFVSGAGAYEALYLPDVSHLLPNTAIARLSLDALKYAQAIEEGDVMRLSMHLYGFNRIPLSAVWRRQYPTPESIADQFGFSGEAQALPLLKENWSPIKASGSNGWYMWSSKHTPFEKMAPAWTYKLYVNPHVKHIQEAFMKGVAVFTETGAHAFKLGQDVYGLLRPDKFIGYFSSLETLHQAAQQLEKQLSGMEVQAVPFTAELCGDGLLSWGMDPPPQKAAVAWQERESWRLLVTNRLALALNAAKQGADHSVEPWQFALQRMQLENIDVANWTPINTH